MISRPIHPAYCPVANGAPRSVSTNQNVSAVYSYEATVLPNTNLTAPALIGAVLILVPGIATYALIVVLMPVLQRYALARPNARSSHTQPTPQGAGIAIIVVSVAVFVLLAALAPGFETGALIPVLAAAVILAFVGAVDDIRTLEVLPRLAAQSFAVLIVIVVLPRDFQILPFLPFWLERAMVFFGLLWFINLVNFMDGIDWMTVAEVVPLTASLALFGFVGALPISETLIALCLCGAMLGFAPLNRPIARVFLGDVGSLPIGLLLGWLLILLAENHLAAAVLLPLYYVGDATITLLRRLVKGERLMHAHRSHFYQRALIGGLSVRAIVVRVALLNIALIVLAGMTMATNSFPLQFIAIAVGGFLVGWQLYRFERGGV
jgi:UDP-N-acetylmuramyl pentapeptide phosphotransferase/UDP-N-acetylglucosamine-1-phosphate transferase